MPPNFVIMNVTPFQCQFCEDKPYFARKFTLNRHIASQHKNSTESFECDECGLRFCRKDNLRIHVEKCHVDTLTFDCADCSMTFRSKHNLIRHISMLHLDTNDNDERIECYFCSSTFSRKYHLRRHIQNVHLVQESRYRCLKCSDVFRYFSSKRNLNRHVLSMHGNTSSVFECFHCSSVFSQKYHLRRHIERVHSVQKKKIKESRFRCLKCSNVFCSSKVLNKHYVDVHGVVLNYQNLEFDCLQSYKEWLENHQHQTLTRFTIWYRTKKTASYSIQRLICHRSGHIRSSLTTNSRKRCLKISGYKRLGGICPAEIRLYIREDGTCFVKYQKTHIGHNIGDESELGRMYLTSEEKRKIAAEIQSGIPYAQIVNRQRLESLFGPGKNISRLGLVTRQDVRNIAVSQNLDFENREYVQRGCDPIDVEVKIAERKNDIVFYKRQAEEDSRFNVLQEEDFVLVVITSNQEKYLRTYGHKVVCLERTHSNNPYEFFLHTLLVLDADEEGLPAAFLLTNRNDQCVVDIFLTCVRDRIGILEPHTLITDTQTMYYNSWVKIMNNPTSYLFCTWHVHEEWRKNYCKIATKKKRDDIRAELLCLSRELDPIKFENGLDSFLTQDDDELENFQYYFRQNYGSNAQRWAYCYQTTTGLNANMAIKSFHQSFKFNFAGGRKIRSATQCLVFIFDYLTLLETDIFEKNVRGKVTNKLRILRNRHREALNQYEEDALSKIIVDNGDTFMVQSFEKTDSFYTILKHESKECDTNNSAFKSCKLVCDWCNLCFHAYHCTCEDSSINSNMCKHIHLVGLYLKDQSLEFDANELQCSNDGMDVAINYTTNDENSSPVNIEDEILENVTIIEDQVLENVVEKIEDRALENAVEIENVSNKKQKLIQRITEQWEQIQKEFTTITESKLQRVYDTIKPIISEAKFSGTHTNKREDDDPFVS